MMKGWQVTRRKSLLLRLYQRLGAVGDDHRTTCLCNLVNQIIIEIDRFLNDRRKSIYTLATIGRNIFEIYLITIYVQQSEENLHDWIGQRVYDEMEVLEAIRKMASTNDDTTWIDNKLDSLRRAANLEKITETRHIPVFRYAEQVGRIDDYERHYKIFSKFTHPSSWTINDNKEKLENEEGFYKVFLTMTEEWLIQFSRLIETFIEMRKKQAI